MTSRLTYFLATNGSNHHFNRIFYIRKSMVLVALFTFLQLTCQMRMFSFSGISTLIFHGYDIGDEESGYLIGGHCLESERKEAHVQNV
jgi:hypothetical protein